MAGLLLFRGVKKMVGQCSFPKLKTFFENAVAYTPDC
jgi:hypothetical protein